MKEIIDLINEQAEDEGLWFVPEYITEDYLQRALRKLHAVIEDNQNPWLTKEYCLENGLFDEPGDWFLSDGITVFIEFICLDTPYSRHEDPAFFGEIQEEEVFKDYRFRKINIPEPPEVEE